MVASIKHVSAANAKKANAPKQTAAVKRPQVGTAKITKPTADKVELSTAKKAQPKPTMLQQLQQQIKEAQEKINKINEKNAKRRVARAAAAAKRKEAKRAEEISKLKRKARTIHKRDELRRAESEKQFLTSLNRKNGMTKAKKAALKAKLGNIDRIINDNAERAALRANKGTVANAKQSAEVLKFALEPGAAHSAQQITDATPYLAKRSDFDGFQKREAERLTRWEKMKAGIQDRVAKLREQHPEVNKGTIEQRIAMNGEMAGTKAPKVAKPAAQATAQAAPKVAQATAQAAKAAPAATKPAAQAAEQAAPSAVKQTVKTIVKEVEKIVEKTPKNQKWIAAGIAFATLVAGYIIGKSSSSKEA